MFINIFKFKISTRHLQFFTCHRQNEYRYPTSSMAH